MEEAIAYNNLISVDQSWIDDADQRVKDQNNGRIVKPILRTPGYSAPEISADRD